MASTSDARPGFPSRSDVGAIIVLVAVFLIALAPKIDTDLWWHLWDGRYILDHHAVPTSDFLSFSSAGQAWTDHEWLAEILLYGLYRLGGLWGTIIGFAFVITATFALVYRRMLITGVTPFLALFVLLGAFFISVPTWGARPQMLTLLFLAALALLLDTYRRSRDRRTLFLFPLLMILWANLHGGWVLGVVLMAVWTVGEWLNWRTGRPGAPAPEALRRLALAVVVTVVASAVTPNGVSGLLYPLVWITPGPFANVLNEWVSVDFHQFIYMVFEAMVLLLLAALLLSRRPVNWNWLLLILTCTYLAFSETRNVAVWAVVLSPILAAYLQGFVADRVTRRPPRRVMQRRTERILNVTLLILVIGLLPVEVLRFVTPQALTQDERSVFPRGALRYMDHHRLPPRTFASYAWGGYLIWRGYPAYRDYIDGRANTIFSAAVLRSYLDASALQPDWNRILTRYHVQNVLAEPTMPLVQGLAEDSRWKRVYRDGTAVLYTRASPASP